jgi:hypothetical protein
VTQRQLLRDECLTALGNYVRQAQQTCELLGAIESTPPSLDRLLAILAQTQAEDNVQQSYLVLRQRFFDVLNETEFRSSELAQAPSNVATKPRRRKARHSQQAHDEG